MKDGDGTNKEPSMGPASSSTIRTLPGVAVAHSTTWRWPMASNPLEVKPDVCWQLPIRRTFEDRTYPDGRELSVVVIMKSSTVVAGVPGGHDLNWYCSGNPDARRAGPGLHQRTTPSSRWMGAPAYGVLVGHCEEHLRVAALGKDRHAMSRGSQSTRRSALTRRGVNALAGASVSWQGRGRWQTDSTRTTRNRCWLLPGVGPTTSVVERMKSAVFG